MDHSVDFADPAAPAEVGAAAVAEFGHLDILIANHARGGGDGTPFEIDAAIVDAHRAVDARSVLPLTQTFARQFRPDRGEVADRSRVIWMTSGRHLAPMRAEIAYGPAKSVPAGMTATVAEELIDLGIVLNTVNPGPVDTGFLAPDTTDLPPEFVEQVHSAFPRGRPAVPTTRPGRSNGWFPTRPLGGRAGARFRGRFPAVTLLIVRARGGLGRRAAAIPPWRVRRGQVAAENSGRLRRCPSRRLRRPPGRPCR
ncbi:SDR family oxidoreductase [Nocardia sienata]|uniref:SDR family oxidoreductase n=1 Tax=Nocardia sienata TaxID=248552 RepID=UPI001C3FA891